MGILEGRGGWLFSLFGGGKTTAAAPMAAESSDSLTDDGFADDLRAGEEMAGESLGVRLRGVISTLGPTFIKAGQVLSTRPDLIPASVCEELKQLQSDCPKVPFDGIRRVLYSEFGGADRIGEIFEWIDEEPLAAASMAQVHRARLVDGSDVVVKVLRPGLRELVRSDIAVMTYMATLAEAFLPEMGMRPRAVVREFTKQLNKEIDLLLELQSTERLAKLFRHNPEVRFPLMYKDASTRNVLTQERIKGKLLARMTRKNSDARELREVLRIGVDAVLSMCLEYGFFHADPHPGNIFVLPGPVLCFIDMGMTGHIEAKTAQDIADYFIGILEGDMDKVIHKAVTICRADPELEHDRSFRAEVHDYLSRFQVDELTLEGLDYAAMMNDFFVIVQKYRIVMPADMVFLAKALATIQGVGQDLDPSFDFIGAARPHLSRLVLQRFSPRALARRALKVASTYLDFAETGPSDVRKLIAMLRRGELSLRLNHTELDRYGTRILFGIAMFSFSIFSGLSFLSISILTHAWWTTRQHPPP